MSSRFDSPRERFATLLQSATYTISNLLKRPNDLKPAMTPPDLPEDITNLIVDFTVDDIIPSDSHFLAYPELKKLIPLALVNHTFLRAVRSRLRVRLDAYSAELNRDRDAIARRGQMARGYVRGWEFPMGRGSLGYATGEGPQEAFERDYLQLRVDKSRLPTRLLSFLYYVVRDAEG